MRLASFAHEDRRRVGVILGDEIVDLLLARPDAPTEMREFLALGAEGRAAAEVAVEKGGNRLPLSEVELLAPVPRPGKFLAVGLNYADHIAETGAETPAYPTIFTKQPTCTNSPHGKIEIPRASSRVDYEGELGIVIGETCRHVAAADAPSVIAGYTIVNDVSVRDWQNRTRQFTMGKSFDTHGPTGPAIVTPDELGDPHRPEHPHPGQRRSAPRLEHEAPDLQLLRHHRVHQHRDDPGTRRHHRNRHPRRRSRRHAATPMAQTRRRSPRGNHEHRRNRKPLHPRAGGRAGGGASLEKGTQVAAISLMRRV